MKSGAQLQTIVGQRTWDKELLLWLGTEHSLLQSIGSAKFKVLDLLDLFDRENLPVDDEETRDQLRDKLRDRLKEIPRGADTRTVLVVKSIGLLARYNVGLNAFYDWFIGSFTMVVLLLDGAMEKVDWPEEVRCDGNKLLGYFSEPGMVKDVFSTTG
jgi:hypothetical protein